MKEPRTERMVEELKETVARLNRLDAILQKMDVRYTLHRTRITDPWKLDDIIQKIEY
jgi:hypothetical protein